MCSTCGCGEPAALTGAALHVLDPRLASGAPVLSRTIPLGRSVLARNDAAAEQNRAWLRDRGVFCLNLLSSPGSGKTTLLVETLRRVRGRFAVAVVEGDQQTALDADRIRAAGAPAVQINTGKGCHLEAPAVGRALVALDPAPGAVVFVENVGNLVCPAAFALGEAHKVVVLSVTEGDDKPLKYPDAFAAADLLVVNKLDLLPYVSFDVDRCVAHARSVRPGLEVVQVSATTGEGLDDWIGWIEAHRPRA